MSGRRCRGRPRLMGLGPELAWGRSADQVGLSSEAVVDRGGGGEKSLSLPLGFEPLHLPPAPADWQMRILSAIVGAHAARAVTSARPRSLAAARYDGSLSVVMVSGRTPWFLSSFRSNFAAACLLRRRWTSISDGAATGTSAGRGFARPSRPDSSGQTHT